MSPHILEPTKDPPMHDRRLITWNATASLLPQPGQRVIWSGRGGRQQHGCYQGDARWLADPDDQHKGPWTFPEQPSLWRPEPD